VLGSGVAHAGEDEICDRRRHWRHACLAGHASSVTLCTSRSPRDDGGRAFEGSCGRSDLDLIGARLNVHIARMALCVGDRQQGDEIDIRHRAAELRQRRPGWRWVVLASVATAPDARPRALRCFVFLRDQADSRPTTETPADCCSTNMTTFGQLVRRLRYGKPIVIVSGLPRSGTSMAMKMLEAGGIPILADGIRNADISNPKGYYEYEPVKELDKGGDAAWLAEARGKAVKIISFLLTWLPETYDYRVILMQRDLREVLASQNAMLAHRGEVPGAAEDEQMLRMYEDHLKKVARFMANRSCFSTLSVDYRDVVQNPRDAAGRINGFLGGTLDVERMAAIADPALYRNRRKTED